MGSGAGLMCSTCSRLVREAHDDGGGAVVVCEAGSGSGSGVASAGAASAGAAGPAGGPHPATHRPHPAAPAHLRPPSPLHGSAAPPGQAPPAHRLHISQLLAAGGLTLDGCATRRGGARAPVLPGLLPPGWCAFCSWCFFRPVREGAGHPWCWRASDACFLAQALWRKHYTREHCGGCPGSPRMGSKRSNRSSFHDRQPKPTTETDNRSPGPSRPSQADEAYGQTKAVSAKRLHHPHHPERAVQPFKPKGSTTTTKAQGHPVPLKLMKPTGKQKLSQPKGCTTRTIPKKL
jgi:hypothetical protein